MRRVFFYLAVLGTVGMALVVLISIVRPGLAARVLFDAKGLASGNSLTGGSATLDGEAPKGLMPLVTTNARMAEIAPPGSLVVHAASATAVTAPLIVTPGDSSSASMTVLSLNEGDGSTDQHGSATWMIHLPEAGDWHLWARVEWRDNCSNSASWRVDDEPNRPFGDDQVYRTWHWVQVGMATLSAGEHALTLVEREDGIRFDQWCLTRDATFSPGGPLSPMERMVDPNAAATGGPDLRRFADDFNRSPGHGLGDWKVLAGDWQLAFSFDPNRIPNQYAMTGIPAADGGAGLVLIDGAPWSGYHLSFHVNPSIGGTASVLLDQHDGEALVVHLQPVKLAEGVDAKQFLTPSPSPLVDALGSCTVTADLRPDQWHRVDIERWGYSLRVSVDGRELRHDTGLNRSGGMVGLRVDHGAVVFDDVRLTAIPWQADDGQWQTLAWQTGTGARWYRDATGDVPPMLVGYSGTVQAGMPGMRIAEVLLQSSPPGAISLDNTGLLPNDAGNQRRWVAANAGSAPSVVRLEARQPEARVQRIAVRFALPPEAADAADLGTFTFANRQLVDPSDYMDFTDDEVAAMKESDDSTKLARQPRIMQVLSAGHEKSAWHRRSGTWQIKDETLLGKGPLAYCEYYQEVGGALDVSLRVQLQTAESTAAIHLHTADPVATQPAKAGTVETPTTSIGQTARLSSADGLTVGDWHTVRARAADGHFTVEIDGRQVSDVPWAPALDFGDRIVFEVTTGSVAFDDVELSAPRMDSASAWYGFDRRESEWWRDGVGWVDHGGIACVLASSWIALVAPETDGARLRLKEPVEGNFALAFTIEENSEWYGWDRKPSHLHFPADNVVAELNVDPDGTSGYRLIICADERKHTILSRNGVPVVTINQDADFPLKYVGGHAPYRPRRSRLILARVDDMLIAHLNGREILRWQDPEPLAARYPALGGDRTRANFSHIEILHLPITP